MICLSKQLTILFFQTLSIAIIKVCIDVDVFQTNPFRKTLLFENGRGCYFMFRSGRSG